MHIPLEAGRCSLKPMRRTRANAHHQRDAGEEDYRTRILWGSGSPSAGPCDKAAEIVGIVGDVRDSELESKGARAVYQPEPQSVDNALLLRRANMGDPTH